MTPMKCNLKMLKKTRITSKRKSQNFWIHRRVEPVTKTDADDIDCIKINCLITNQRHLSVINKTRRHCGPSTRMRKLSITFMARCQIQVKEPNVFLFSLLQSHYLKHCNFRGSVTSVSRSTSLRVSWPDIDRTARVDHPVRFIACQIQTIKQLNAVSRHVQRKGAQILLR